MLEGKEEEEEREKEKKYKEKKTSEKTNSHSFSTPSFYTDIFFYSKRFFLSCKCFPSNFSKIFANNLKNLIAQRKRNYPWSKK